MHTISLKPGLAAKLQRAWQKQARRLGNACRSWQRARRAEATAQALNQLDDRLLHDLGLDRSELRSTAAELHGRIARERRHAFAGSTLPR